MRLLQLQKFLVLDLFVRLVMTSNKAPILDLDHVQTKFGTKVVHSNITLSLRNHGVHAIIGESGCGKSVLLREIIGLLRPTQGRIRLLGESVWEIPEARLMELRSRYAVLFQDSALFSSLTVAENVAAPLKEQMALTESWLNEVIDLKLYLSGLDSRHRNKLPSELSGGMRKRAALARALALDPEILFLDEPTSGLDPITSRMFDQVIRTLVDGLQLTVLLITHDIDTILGIVDNLIVLGGSGTILAEGPVSEIRRLPHPWIQQYFSSRT